MVNRLWVPVVAIGVFVSTVAFGQVPSLLNFSGRLGTASGDFSGVANVELTLYDDATSTELAHALWSDKQDVYVDAGRFHLLLGADPGNPLPDGLLASAALFVGVSVNGEAEMQPRMRVASVPFALYASDARTLGGVGPEGFAAAGHTHGFGGLTGVVAEAQLPPGVTMDVELAAGLAGKSDVGHNHDATYVNEGQVASVTTEMVVDRTLLAQDLADWGCAPGQVAKWQDGGWGCGDDVDTTTAYLAGTGLVLAGLEFSVDEAVVRGWCYDQPTELYSLLDTRYAATVHNHDTAYYRKSEIDAMFLQALTQMQSALATKADQVHTHAIASVTGLQAALDGKAAVNHTHNYDATYVNEGQADSVTSAMIKDGEVTFKDLAVPTSCLTGQAIKLVSGGWACAADDTVTQATVEAWAKGVCFDTPAELAAALPLWDQKASDDLVVGTVFGGDVTGTYNNLQIVAGAVGAAEIADATRFGSIQNATGVEQFAVTDGNPALQFAGGGATTVLFDATTHRVTISASEGDGVVGNEVVGATDASLARGGSGTAASPYTLALNLANGNAWAAGQTFQAGAKFPGSGIWDPTGNVGIGIATPGTPLDVAGVVQSRPGSGVGTGEVRLLGSAGTAYTGFRAPAALNASTVYTLPPATPTAAGQVLTGNPAGALSWTLPSAGTVTSVGLALPGQFTVQDSPVTAAGVLTASWLQQPGNAVLAGPSTGVSGVPSFRALVAADVPNVDASKITGGLVPPVRGGTGLDTSNASGVPNLFLGTWSVSPQLPVAQGGTGLWSCDRGEILVGSGSNTYTRIGAPVAGNVLTSTGATGVGVQWGKVNLQNHVLGTLLPANGGTGLTAVGGSGAVAYSDGSYYAFTAQGNNGQFLKSTGTGTPTWAGISATDVPSGSDNYVQNNTSPNPQSASFWVSGTGAVDGGLIVKSAGDALSATANGASVAAVRAVNLGNGYGVYASSVGGDGLYATVGTSAAAVRGVATALGAGIYGQATGGGYGVYGTSVAGYAVFGNSASGFGVYGTSTTGRGAYFESNSTSKATVLITNLGGASSPGLYVDGTFIATGTKSFVADHPTDPTQSIYYAALEGPEAGMYVRGKATLVEGAAVVVLPQHFALLVAPDSLTASLTPRSAASEGLATVALSPTGMTVRELRNGSGTYEFDYVVYGVRDAFRDFQVVRPRMAGAGVP